MTDTAPRIAFTPDGNPINATGQTFTYNAIHYAHHQGYLTRNQTLDALNAGRPAMTDEQFDRLHDAWKRRHGLTPNT